LRYAAFRSQYEIKRKVGLLKISYPSSPEVKEFISLKEWKNLNIPFLFADRSDIKVIKNRHETLPLRSKRILEGDIQFFNRDWMKVEDWIKNPDSGYIYDITQHWTEVEDISKKAGDIKYVWEKSRFSYFIDIVRYDYHFDEDNSEFVFSEIDSWMTANPINMGPNYKCSQETSLRCLNWIFALHFYKNSNSLTDERWKNVLHYIYWQIKHVYSNINFSKICVRNNHAITECMMIYFGGLLFPFFAESKNWIRKGKKWLESEILYQVYEDGTYLQYSHNYQRVLMQLLTWTVSISKLHDQELSKSVLDRCGKVVDYMSHVCIGNDGQVPNYGSNDGALFFKLNNEDYSDFRPTINALHFVLSGEHLYDDVKLQEDAYWYSNSTITKVATHSKHSNLTAEFIKGGIYTLKDRTTFTFIKCAKYIDRPAQADNMHLDLWVDGINLLRDSGTYKYNTDNETINYFVGTAGHNAVMLGNHNQMAKGSRFIWFDWTKNVKVNVINKDKNATIQAVAEMFYSLNSGIFHDRKVEKAEGELRWSIKDEVDGNNSAEPLRQIWHPNPNEVGRIRISAIDEEGKELERLENKGYWSEYYGEKIEVPVWIFESNTNKIYTTIEIDE